MYFFDFYLVIKKIVIILTPKYYQNTLKKQILYAVPIGVYHHKIYQL